MALYMNALFKYNNMQITSKEIEDKLADPNTTLEDLLVEDEIIQELINQNSKLLKFFTKDRVKDVVNYIITEPKEDDQLKGHKFPWICSELLNVEENTILNYFLYTDSELAEINKKELANNRYANTNENSIELKKDENETDSILDKFEKEAQELQKKDNNLPDTVIKSLENPIQEPTDTPEEEKSNEQNPQGSETKMEVEEKKDDKKEEEKKGEEKKEEEKKEDDKKEEDKKIEDKKEEDKKEEDKKEDKKDDDKKDKDNTTDNNNKTNEENKPTNEDSTDSNKPQELLKLPISKNQEESKEGSSDRIAMLDYFFSFLETKEKLNYVLAGYFSKFFSSILMKKPMKIVDYLFMKRKDILERMVDHCYRNSIADLLVKVLPFENLSKSTSRSNSITPGQTPQQDTVNNETALAEVRASIIEKIFSKLNIIGQSDTETIPNTIYILNELTKSKKILGDIVENTKFMKQIFEGIKIDLNSEENHNKDFLKSNYTELIGFLIELLNKIKNESLKTPSYDIIDDLVEQGHNDHKIIHTVLSSELFDAFDNIIENFNPIKIKPEDCKKLKTSYNIDIIPLGSHRIAIVELLSSMFSYFKNIPSHYDKILIKANFIDTAMKYLFSYEWNNLYQQALLAFFKNYLKDSATHPDLSTYIFETLNLPKIIKIHTEDMDTNNKYKYSPSQRLTGHGYIPFLISLSYKINSIIGGAPLSISSRSREGSMCFVNKTEGSDLLGMFGNIGGFCDSNRDSKSLSGRKSTKGTTVESMKKYFNDDWSDFFTKNIRSTVKLYEQKLCDKNNNTGEDDELRNRDGDGEDDSSKNPFASKDDLFFSGGWDTEMNREGEMEGEGQEVNVTDFEFVEEERSPKGEDSSKKLVVDELDTQHAYGDSEYWCPKPNEEIMNEALKELEISDK